jgi:hypothetical protein
MTTRHHKGTSALAMLKGNTMFCSKNDPQENVADDDSAV